MNNVRRLAGACLLVLAGVTSVVAQGQLVPVMRLGHWIEVGGALPLAWVLQAQERLKAAGFDPSSIDGTLGPQTRDALRRYQQTRNLPATGELDEGTLQALGIK
jgi:peptidoglycan hydrolase-like protein with peptidoglycan-binding domain